MQKKIKSVLYTRQHSVTRNSGRGFTLVELVTVIVIIGILTATALPLLLNLGRDARIAALQSMSGALTTAARMAYMKCATSSECDQVAWGDLTINGTKRLVWYGWPIEASRGNVWWSISDMVDYSGFSYSNTRSPKATAFFDLASASDPSTCRVSYFYQDRDVTPIITTTASGC